MLYEVITIIRYISSKSQIQKTILHLRKFMQQLPFILCKDNCGRITSYNVCYTKLLRGEQGLLGSKFFLITDSVVIRIESYFNTFQHMLNHVITSYSIHYAKLYDIHSFRFYLLSVFCNFSCYFSPEFFFITQHKFPPINYLLFLLIISYFE